MYTLLYNLDSMATAISATEARNNFFTILNKVLFGNETVLISKAGSDVLVKIERAADGREILRELAGSIANAEAEKMEDSIMAARLRETRDLPSFNN